jgi:hypothetical protein
MNAHQFLTGNGEHVERIVVTQVRLHGEREFAEVGKLFEVGRMRAGRLESLLVVRDIVVGVLERPGDALCLQGHQLVARGALGVIQFGPVAACRSHPAFP